MGRPRKQPLKAVPAETLEAAQTGGVRGMLGIVLDEEATLDAIRQTVLDAIGAEKASTVTCKHCGEEFRAPVADVKKQVDAIIALLEQNEGRAGERPPEATQVVIVRPPL